MNGITLLLINSLMTIQVQTSDSLINVPNLKAFTHPEFFNPVDCECNKFDFNGVYLSAYSKNEDYTGRSSIIPPNFEVGFPVTIVAENNKKFLFIIEDGVTDSFNQNVTGVEFFTDKGELGTWIYNYNDNTYTYMPVPLYAEPSVDSKIVELVPPEHSVALILDIKDGWMLVEPITKGERIKGWLNPKMQCGNPFGLHAGHCNNPF